MWNLRETVPRDAHRRLLARKACPLWMKVAVAWATMAAAPPAAILLAQKEDYREEVAPSSMVIVLRWPISTEPNLKSMCHLRQRLNSSSRWLKPRWRTLRRRTWPVWRVGTLRLRPRMWRAASSIPNSTGWYISYRNSLFTSKQQTNWRRTSRKSTASSLNSPSWPCKATLRISLKKTNMASNNRSKISEISWTRSNSSDSTKTSSERLKTSCE